MMCFGVSKVGGTKPDTWRGFGYHSKDEVPRKAQPARVGGVAEYLTLEVSVRVRSLW